MLRTLTSRAPGPPLIVQSAYKSAARSCLSVRSNSTSAQQPSAKEEPAAMAATPKPTPPKRPTVAVTSFSRYRQQPLQVRKEFKQVARQMSDQRAFEKVLDWVPKQLNTNGIRNSPIKKEQLTQILLPARVWRPRHVQKICNALRIDFNKEYEIWRRAALHAFSARSSGSQRDKETDLWPRMSREDVKDVIHLVSKAVKAFVATAQEAQGRTVKGLNPHPLLHFLLSHATLPRREKYIQSVLNAGKLILNKEKKPVLLPFHAEVYSSASHEEALERLQTTTSQHLDGKRAIRYNLATLADMSFPDALVLPPSVASKAIEPFREQDKTGGEARNALRLVLDTARTRFNVALQPAWRTLSVAGKGDTAYVAGVKNSIVQFADDVRVHFAQELESEPRFGSQLASMYRTGGEETKAAELVATARS